MNLERRESAHRRSAVMAVGAILLAIFGTPGVTIGETIDYIPDIGLACGKGFDSLSAEVKRVPFESRDTADLPGGQAVEHDILQVENIVQLEESLDVSAGGSYGCGVFKASAKAEYMRSHSMDRYSMYILVSVKVRNRETEVSKPTLSQEAKDLLAKPNGLELFHKAYGDRYVSGVVTGGEYHGILRVETKSETDKQAIAASVSASGFGWSAKGRVETALGKYSKDHTFSVKNIIQGGEGLRPPATVNDMLAFGEAFPARVKAAGYPIKVVLSDYSVFPEYQRQLSQLDVTRKLVMRDVAYNYLDYRAMRNDIDFVLKRPEQFRFMNEGHRRTLLAALRTQARDIEKKLIELEDAKQGILDDRLSPKTFADLGITSAEVFGAGVLLPPRYRSYAADLEITPPAMEVFPLDYVPKGSATRHLVTNQMIAAGDGDMKGHRPWIRMAAVARPIDRGAKLVVELDVAMQESQKDFTTFRKSARREVFDVTRDYPDLRIAKVWPAEGMLRSQGGKSDHGWHTYRGTGLIAKADNVRSDIRGREHGVIGAKAVHLAPIKIAFVHVEDVAREPYRLIQYSPTPTGAAPPVAKAGRRSVRIEASKRATLSGGVGADAGKTERPRRRSRSFWSKIGLH